MGGQAAGAAACIEVGPGRGDGLNWEPTQKHKEESQRNRKTLAFMLPLHFGDKETETCRVPGPGLGMERQSLYLCFFEITKDLVQHTVESPKYVRHEEGHWRGVKPHIEMNNSKCLVILKLQVHGPNRKSASLNVFKRALTQE